MIKHAALKLLRTSLADTEARFRNNQWEAIDLLVNQNKKLLVVERTGWGKSSVYFISTRILRDKGKGPTIIISPLLALMRNQIEAAERLGIKAVSINSTNTEEWDSIKVDVLNNKVDALLISPERLANEGFVEKVLRPIANNIGLFVVDEAHCISDWGHDFRTDYKRITNVLKLMPDGMPILGTTATANDRVVNDIVTQLGDVHIIRGSLMRESLVLQNIRLKDQASRLAWLKENIPNMPGSGLIYALTVRDAQLVTNWLNECGIEVGAYHSGVEHENFDNSDAYRQYLEDALYNNELKALVTTSALGMGYDKPDLGFVIHYQSPGSVISYYQQVGRAGRGIKKAFGILLSGNEDKEINDYFIDSAFPSEAHVKEMLEVLEVHDGLSIIDLMGHMNLKRGQLEKILQYLSTENPSPVTKSGTKWYRTAVHYEMDIEKIQWLTNQKRQEWGELQQYIETTDCLMNYLQYSLDDPYKSKGRCGKCATCADNLLFNKEPKHKNIVEAASFLKQAEFDFKPLIQIKKGALPVYGWSGNLPVTLRAAPGKVLSRWGDAGWGRMVAEDKRKGHFRDELVLAVAEMIKNRWTPQPFPTWITCIPSNRHPKLVPDFSRRLSEQLGIPFLPVVLKVKETEPQKEQENSYFQCKNLDGVFEIDENVQEGPVLLIDDAVDSGWTFTIVAALLRQAGSGTVFPVALTSTAIS